MKKKNKKLWLHLLIGTLAIGILSTGSMGVVDAKSQNVDLNTTVKIEKVNADCKTSKLLTDVGTMSVKENLVVENTRVPLYVTFDFQEEALQNISANPVIQAIKTEYGYEDISNGNWKEYYDAMYELLDAPSCPSWYNEGDINYRTIRQFFDIYENEEKNAEIISLATTATTATDITQCQDILELLPYDSYVELDKQLTVSNSEQLNPLAVVAGFDTSKGITYATSYATSPNTSSYKKFSSDCTNFTSQILENGGVAQVKYNDETKGWWHTKTKKGLITVHEHSISWIRADTFAKYMGVGYSTTSHSSFSSNIAKGDFIAADFKNDGDWDHMGFVTDKKSSKSNGYYDYKIAQHTKNYHAWTSSSTNSWEDIGTEGGKYGRVRR